MILFEKHFESRDWKIEHIRPYICAMRQGIDHPIILLLGSNLGESLTILERAIVLISDRIGEVTDRSKLYESEPWGFDSSDVFLNQAIVIRSNLGPRRILAAIWQIEKELGRERHGTEMTSRTIDIDILTWGKRFFWTRTLQVPHIQIQFRRFALLPLCDLVGDMKHPVLGITFNQLLDECPDSCWARPLMSANV